MEYNNLVDTVKEFGIERLFQFIQDVFLYFFIHHLGYIPLETERCRLFDQPGPKVRSHDDHGIPEIHLSSETVCEHTFIKNLQEYIEDIGMRLLYLVERGQQNMASS